MKIEISANWSASPSGPVPFKVTNKFKEPNNCIKLSLQPDGVVAKIPFLMLQAFWMYITLMALWSAWVLSVAFLATSGSIVVDQATGYVTTDRKTDQRNFNFITLKYDSHTQRRLTDKLDTFLESSDNA